MDLVIEDRRVLRVANDLSKKRGHGHVVCFDDSGGLLLFRPALRLEMQIVGEFEADIVDIVVWNETLFLLMASGQIFYAGLVCPELVFAKATPFSASEACSGPAVKLLICGYAFVVLYKSGGALKSREMQDEQQVDLRGNFVDGIVHENGLLCCGPTSGC